MGAIGVLVRVCGRAGVRMRGAEATHNRCDAQQLQDGSEGAV